jgi:hypothetical protein
MADEIQVTTRLTVSNDGYKEERAPSRLKVTQAARGGAAGVQAIGTTYEAIGIGDVTTEGYTYIRNLDDTNFVQVGVDGGASLTPLIRLNAGEFCVFRIDAAATLFALADTAACDIDVMILEA